jgi:hypothetical protein
MLIFNIKALIAVGIGIAVAASLGAATNIAALAIIGGFGAAMLADVWMRFHSEDCDRALIHPDAGGHVWFVPVWVMGIILMNLLGLSHFRII